MLGLPLTFAAPLVLTALAALPAIWLLLRITPPQPRRVDFPPLKILADLRPEQETPARTPWWLLLLRLLLAAFLILAAAGPIWNPLAEDSNRAPLLIVRRQRLRGRPRLARAHEPCRRAHRGGGTRGPRRRARGDGGRAGGDRACRAPPPRWSACAPSSRCRICRTGRPTSNPIRRFLRGDARCRDRLDQRRGRRR